MELKTSDTRRKILEAARLAVQARGYNGLSFRELAKTVGIKSASIHHHFPTKGDLGAALAKRYTSDFAEYLETLLADSLGQEMCIQKYTERFRSTLLNENRICLGGILSAEYDELPTEVRDEVVKFSEMNINWLVRVLSLRKKAAADMVAILRQSRAIYAAVLGAQLVARGRGDVSVYDELIEAYRTARLLP